MSWEYCWTDSILLGGLARSLSVAESRFHGFRCGKFPIPVRLGAWGTGMKFTNFADRRTTNSTRHSQNLLRGEFLGFHNHMMERCTQEKMFNKAHFPHLFKWPGINWSRICFPNSEQN